MWLLWFVNSHSDSAELRGTFMPRDWLFPQVARQMVTSQSVPCDHGHRKSAPGLGTQCAVGKA